MITIEEEDLVEWISQLLRSEHSETDGEHVFTVTHPPQDVRLRISTVKIRSILISLASKQEENETALFDGKTYECLVRDESRFGLPLLRRPENEVTKEDLDAGLTYRISLPSDEYLVFLLAKVNLVGSVHALRTPMTIHRLRRHLEAQTTDEDVLNVLKAMVPRLLTVQIKSKRVKALQDMSKHANAFLFQLAYNLNIPVVESRYLDDLVRGRILIGRRSTLEDIEPPKRLYVTDLIYHYQMGVSTDSPSHEYLSYYHVAEHFFEEVYNDDLINSVRRRITEPGFSYRRKKDIQDLIREINRRLKIRDESVTFNEQEALRLTLQKYVNFDDIRTKVREYDSTLFDYYRNNKVPFSGGTEVDLEEKDSTLPESLAKRIYKTRNSIVHSKESEKGKYIPFEHDKVLVKEVPLLRFLAEGIIIDTSTVIS